MNWIKVILAGVAAGIVVWLVNFVLHQVIMGPTYMEHSAFTREEASPFLFLFVSICVAITVCILFARSYKCWPAGWKGGAIFGFFVGLAAFFTNFYLPLVIAGFPYFLAWCWGGINVINGVIGGAVLGLVYKP